jgi:hypothetical protein
MINAKVKIFLWLCLSVGITCLVPSASSGAIKIKASPSPTALERYYVKDFTGYLAKIFTDAIDTSGVGTTFNIVIGTVSGNTLIAAQITGGRLTLPTGKNANQGYAIKTIDSTIYVAAVTDTGIGYGLYNLLEQYGVYFQISGEVLPAQAAYAIKSINLSLVPVFRYRALFPWDNFLMGMSGWNETDFDLFIDRMARLRLNMIQFHFYPGLAYYNEVYSNGSRVDPWFIADWANNVVPSRLIGSQAFGSLAYFGNKEYHDNNTAQARAAACQAMLKRVLDYAHSRGLATVVGFALMQPQGGGFTMTTTRGWNPMPDPLVAKNADLEVERYRRLVSIYPNSDYYWMWQTEAGGNFWKTVTNDASATAMRNQYANWCTDANRKGDIDYAYLFWQTVNKLTAAEQSRIATGGWDISRLFPGFNQTCPAGIIFHNMNSWFPPEGIRGVQQDYTTAIQSGRRGWMTDWWEYDGLVWFPEFRVKKQETMYKACATNGLECISLDGWKQSGVEHNIRYLADFSWNSALTGTQFHSDYSAKLYGEAARTTMSTFYNYYDDIEDTMPAATTGDYRDMNLAEGWNTLQLSTYATTTAALTTTPWTTITSQCRTLLIKQQNLVNRDLANITTLQNLRPPLSAAGQYWLDLMINRLTFRTIYVSGLLDINQSYLTFDQAAKASGIAAGKTAAVADLQKALTHMADAINKYAECIRNTSDMGVVAQLNLQVYDVLKKFFTDNGGVVAIRDVPFKSGMLSLRKTIKSTQIYSLDGKLVAQQKTANQGIFLSVKKTGVYFIKINNDDGSTNITKRLIINNNRLLN